MGWEVYPEGLTELLLAAAHATMPCRPFTSLKTAGPSRTTGSMAACTTRLRTDYIARHIAAVAEAIRQGVPMEGYMVWSLLDNFEWASGYEKRFGIVHVDYATQQRTLKDSALWYRDFLHHQTAMNATSDSAPTKTGHSEWNTVALGA